MTSRDDPGPHGADRAPWWKGAAVRGGVLGSKFR